MNEHHHDHPDIGCLEAIEGLYELLDGEVADPARAAEIEAHIAHCQSCYSRAEIERAITARIRRLHQQSGDGGTQPPEHLRQRLRDLLDKL